MASSPLTYEDAGGVLVDPNNPTATTQPASADTSSSADADYAAAGGVLVDQSGDNSMYNRTPGGLYHYMHNDGTEVYSKNAPNPSNGDKPYVIPDATSGMSGFDEARAAYGRAYIQKYRGAKQIALHTLHALGQISDQELADNQQQIDDLAQQDAPLMNTTGGKVGDFLGQASQTALVPGGIWAQAGSQALSGALDPTKTGDSRVSNIEAGAIGGAAGTAGANFLGRLISPVRSHLAPYAKQALEVLDRNGVQTSLAQRTGSRAMQSIDRVVKDSPGVQPSTFAADTKGQFTNAALKTIGESGENVTQDTLDAAQRRITSTLDSVVARNPININTKLSSGKTFSWEMANARNQILKPGPMGEQQASRIASHIDRLEAAIQPDGSIDPEVFAGVRRDISDFYGQGANYEKWGGKLGDMMDEAIAKQTASKPGEFQLYQTAKNQFMNLKKLTAPNVINQVDGTVNPTALFNKYKNTKNAQFGGQDQELWDLARAGHTILGDDFANSGTPHRLASQTLMGALGLAALRASPGDVAKIGIIGGLMPKAGRYINEGAIPRAYLSTMANNPIAAGITEGLDRAGGIAGGTLLRNASESTNNKDNGK